MGTQRKPNGNSMVATPSGSIPYSQYNRMQSGMIDDGTYIVDPNFVYTGNKFGPFREGQESYEQKLADLKAKQKEAEAKAAAELAVFLNSHTTLYGDALAGYEGVRNPLGAAVGAAQAQDAYASAVEEGLASGDKTQFKYGFTDDPEVAKADYERRIPQVIAEGGDPSMLQEALGKLQTQDPNIVLDEDDEGDDEESLTFEDFVNPLLTFFDPSTIVGPLGPIDMGEVGPFIPQGGEGDDTGVDPGNGTDDDTGVGTATPTVPPVAPAEPVPDTVPSTEPDGNLEPDLDPTPDPTVVSDEIVTDDQAVVTIPEIIKPKSTESKRQLFDIVTSATPITESILFSPQFVDLDNIQLGMFDAFLKASGGK